MADYWSQWPRAETSTRDANVMAQERWSNCGGECGVHNLLVCKAKTADLDGTPSGQEAAGDLLNPVEQMLLQSPCDGNLVPLIPANF